MGEVVTWLVDNAGQIKNIVEFGSLILGAILAFRKWVLKPVIDLIAKNEESIIALKKDYDNKREVVFNEVAALRKELADIDQRSEGRHSRLREDFKDMRKEMGKAQDDIADILGNELEAGHHKFMAQGWCSPGEKKHYVELHRRYFERGHNHLAQHYEEDLLALPDEPPMVK